MMSLSVSGRINSGGALVAADPALLRLQERAGGALGGPLALPQLARLAALSLRLQRSINRSLHAADDQNDIFAQVMLNPDPDGVDIVISDWRTVAARESATRGEDVDQTAIEAPLDGGWHWECDAQLRLIRLGTIDGSGASTPWQGIIVSEIFALEPDSDGRLPVLSALAEKRSFSDQRVRLPKAMGSAQSLHSLSGKALFDAQNGFSGFRGWIAPVRGAQNDRAAAGDSQEEGAMPRIADPAFGSLPLSDPRFGRRIDGALRGPLSRIVASAETISGQFEGPIRADYARYAADIAHAARHLLGLIDDLADLQSIERPGFHAAREAVDLADVARRAVGLLAMKAEEKQIRIDAPAHDEKLSATGEFRRVLQVLLNLIGNAIRYSPEGSMIWIRCESSAGMASITVADQGQGLSEEQQAVVFEKFERLGRTDTGGSGLGLYIARRLARAMDGDLTVDSAPGQGARFTLTIPAV